MLLLSSDNENKSHTHARTHKSRLMCVFYMPSLFFVSSLSLYTMWNCRIVRGKDITPYLCTHPTHTEDTGERKIENAYLEINIHPTKKREGIRVLIFKSFYSIKVNKKKLWTENVECTTTLPWSCGTTHWIRSTKNICFIKFL